jgi:son of sevenless-like protein
MTASMSGGILPAPLLPRNFKKIKFLDVDPLEIARQFTIMDSRLFAKITVEECLAKAWPKKFGNKPTPNFTAIADLSNAVSIQLCESGTI